MSPVRCFTKTIVFTVVAVLSTVGGASLAADVAETPATHDVIDTCLQRAARHHGVGFRLLRAIAMVESGLDPTALNRTNANGSRDIGLMQINSSWLPRLARSQIFEADLLDPCISAYVGAWILADNIARLGAVWRAVGAYNARTPARQLAYVKRVQRQLAIIKAPPRASR